MAPTPSSEYDVQALVNYIVGWSQLFAAAANGMPAQMVLNMTLMEYVTHGCDLAMTTGQPVPFSEHELAIMLDRGRATLPEEYRGEGKTFGPIIGVADDAPGLDRVLGFMGRQPCPPVTG